MRSWRCAKPGAGGGGFAAAVRRLGVDAIIVFSDILIVAEARAAVGAGRCGPNLPSPVRTASDVAKLKQFDPEVETRYLMDALRILSREAGANVPVLGFAAARGRWRVTWWKGGRKRAFRR